MPPSMFAFKDYRAFIHAAIKAEEKSWGLMSRLAEAAGCQRSHLSRVLSSEVHFTLEQAHGLAEFWNLSDAETEYFTTLVEHERAGNARYRARLDRKLRRLRQEHEDLAKRLQQPSIEVQDREFLYYSAWYWVALHIAITIPRLQTLPALAENLGVPEPLLRTCLETLEKQGLVRREGQRWKFNSETSHLPKASPLVSLHHANWRHRAILDAQNPLHQGIHYTMVQSVSAEAFERIKELLLKTIDEYNAIAGPSKEEDLICFTADFFKIC